MNKEKYAFKDKINNKSATQLNELKSVLSRGGNNRIKMIEQPTLNFQLQKITDIDFFSKINTLKNDQFNNVRSLNNRVEIKKHRNPNPHQKYNTNNSKSQQLFYNQSQEKLILEENYQFIREGMCNNENNKIDKFGKSIKPLHKIANSDIFSKIFYSPNKQNREKQFQIVDLLINDLQKSTNNQKKSLHSKSFVIKQNKRSSYESQNYNKKQEIYNSYSCKKSIQRKKYEQLKSKLQNMLNAIQSTDNINFSQVFEVEQLIIKKFLNEYIQEIKKQCIQKGQFIELIWNSFLELIDRIMNFLTEKTRNIQRSQVKNSLMLHEQYQQLYQNSMRKIKQLGKKYNESKHVIDRLIFDLRYKRKQTKKLYKNLAFCNEQVIRYKEEYTTLQNHYIDNLMQTQLINEQSSLELIKKRQNLDRDHQQWKKIKKNKQKIKEQIFKQINEQKMSLDYELKLKKQLVQKINKKFNMTSNGNLKKSTISEEQTQQKVLIDQFIEKYSSKCILSNEAENINDIQNKDNKIAFKNVAVNTDFELKVKGELISITAQTTFSDKIQNQLIRNYPTQTLVPKVMKVQSVEVQADGDKMKIIYTKSKMTKYKLYDLSFYFDSSYKNATLNMLIDCPNHNRKSTIDNESFHQIKEFQRFDAERQKKSSKNLIQSEQGISKFLSKRVTGNKNSLQYNQHSKTTQPSVKLLSRQGKRPSPKVLIKEQDKVEEITIPKKQVSKIFPAHKSSSVEESKQLKDEKQNYFDSLVNKKQQYDLIDPKQIYENFRKSFIQETSNQGKNSNEQGDEELDGQNVLSMYEKNKQRHSNFKKNQEELIKQKALGFKIEKQKLRTSLMLNRIVQYSVKKSKAKKLLDQQNFDACKQKSEYFSITQKLDPLLLDVDTLLKQKLGKGKLIRSVQLNPKTANRYIMMTYTKAIEKMSKNTTILENLIKPLYQSFELVYGALRPMQIYKKMVSFISYMVYQRDENQNFGEFIYFLGLDQKKQSSGYLTTLDICLYLKMIEKLNLSNGKMNSQIQAVWTSKKKVSNELFYILLQQNMCHDISRKVTDKVLDVLERLDEMMKDSAENADEDEKKINLFKVSRMIVEEIIKIRMSFLKKLEEYIKWKPKKEVQPRRIKDQKFITQDILKIIQICQFSSLKKLYSVRSVEQLSILEGETKMIKKNQLAILLLKVGVLNFDELDIRFSQSAKMRHQIAHELNSSSVSTPNKIIQRIDYEIQIKNLQNIEKQVEEMVGDIICDVEILNSFGLIKLLEHSTSNQLK